MAEAFVNTLKRDYVSGADRSDPETLLDQVAAWIADYNTVAPHSALGYRSPPSSTEPSGSRRSSRLAQSVSPTGDHSTLFNKWLSVAKAPRIPGTTAMQALRFSRR